MTERKSYRALVLSVVKHDYIARAFVAHPRFELVGVADDADVPEWIHERNREFATSFDLPYETNLSKAVEEFSPDVAIISSEAERHCDLAVCAAQHGLHIVVDKPMSTRLTECDRLVAAIDEAGVKCLLWNRNFLPALCRAKELVDAGEIGNVRAAHCDFYFAKDAGPAIGSRQPGDPPIDWLERQMEAHADGSDGGVGVEPMGELQVEGIYPLAYLRYLIGKNVERVFARTTTHFHQAHADNSVDDLASVTLEMSDDVIGSICIGRIGAASHPELGEIKLHLTGTKGALVVSESRPEAAVYYQGQPPDEYRHIRTVNDCDFLLANDFLRAIETDADTILDANAGRDICAVVDACLRSANSGQVEDVSY